MGEGGYRKVPARIIGPASPGFFRVTLNPDADKPSDMDLAIELIPIELRKPNADLIIQFKNTKITRVTGLAF